MVKPTSASNQKKPPPTAPKPKFRRKEPEQAEQQPLDVYCRLRTLKNEDDTAVMFPVTSSLLQVGLEGERKSFQFKYIFDDSSRGKSSSINQRLIFKEIGLPLISDLIRGQNGLLFTYGVTGAGKTFTVTGSPDCPGILPRILDVLFNSFKNNNLQTIKNIFKPDGQNSFDVRSSADAILQLQNEINSDVGNTPGSVYGTPTAYNNARQNFATPRSARYDTKKVAFEALQREWSDRQREEEFIKDVDHDKNYAVFVSFVEIYNNYIYDLLDDAPDVVPQRKAFRANQQQNVMRSSKALREDSKKRMFVQGATELEVKNADEAFESFLKGVNRRKTASTRMNADSSRSHSVFTIRLVQAPLDRNGAEVLEVKEYIHISQLSIVDLAGCERAGRTIISLHHFHNPNGNRLAEAGNLNKSLMTLRICFDALRENQKSQTPSKIVPYRDSKLTHLFKNYFEGDGAVKMMLCLNPGISDLAKTEHVLIFGEKSKEITTHQGRRAARSFFPENDDFEDLTMPLNSGPASPKRFLEEPEDDQIIPEWLAVTLKRKEEITTHKGRSAARSIFPKNLDFEDLTMPLNFGPAFPKRFLEEPEDDQIIPEWLAIALKRKEETNKSLESYMRRMASIRQSITCLEDENSHFRQENSRLNNDLKARESLFGDSQLKIINLQRDNERLKVENEQKRQQIDNLMEELTNKNCACVLLQKDVELTRSTMHNNLTRETARLKEWAQKMMADKRDELERMMCLNLEKLEQAKNILLGDDDVMSQFHLLSPSRCMPSTSASLPGAQVALSRRVQQQEADPQIAAEPATTTANKVTKGQPVSNPKYTPNLNEGGGKWIDHQPPGIIETGTILQPTIKNCKSVTNLKTSDFKNGKYTRYAVTHHESTVSGGIETQVYKGNVIPTTTGGAQVLFNDVETLKQASPAPNGGKRPLEVQRQQTPATTGSSEGAGTSSNATPTASSATAK